MFLQRLKDLREDNDYKQSDIADFLNCKQQTYSNYETGKREIPYEVLINLANHYETSTDYILGLTNEKKPYPRIKK